MFRMDLKAAGIPYVVQGPDGPLFADFHCLRHSFIALLDKSGATLKEAMHLARHSDPKLTMAVYGKAQLHDLGEAVRRLPMFSSPWKESTHLRATGTEGGKNMLAQPLAQTPDFSGDRVIQIETQTASKDRPLPEQKTHEEMRIPASFVGSKSNSGGWDRTTDTRLMKPLL